MYSSSQDVLKIFSLIILLELQEIISAINKQLGLSLHKFGFGFLTTNFFRPLSLSNYESDRKYNTNIYNSFVVSYFIYI
jgi:hypothetical protein